MNEKILFYTSKIEKELFKKKKRLNLDNLLLNVENNQEVRKIKEDISQKVSNIEELQRFLSPESQEIKKIMGEISILKTKLYEIKDVKKYNNALAKYNEYIDYINKEIFNI